MGKQWLDKKLYPDVQDRWDDKIFRKIILEYLNSDSKLLDLGAGSGRVSEMNFRDQVNKVYGVDPDPNIKDNPYIDESIVGKGEELPYNNNYFEVIISDNVLEHLTNPEEVFEEVNRILKPGGYFIFKTPNKYHYMPLIARLTPHVFHEWVNEKRGRDVEDTFPTQYLANSKKDIKVLASKTDFIVDRIELYEGRPEYLRFSSPTYLLGWLYERIVNKTEALENLRILLVGVLKKAK